MSIRKMQTCLLKVLLVLMPYHYLLFAILLKDISVLKLWRDFVIIIIFLLGIVKKGKISINSTFIANSLLVVLNLLYIILAPNKIQAINITRVYLLPILLFQSVKELHLDRNEISKIARLVMCNTMIICIYGIVQAYILGAPFLIKLGYETNSKGMLSASYYLSNYGGSVIGRNIQRVVSTFSAANICAFYLSMVFLIFLFAKNYFAVNKKIYFIFMIIVFSTIILTFSRSSWLAIAIAVIFVGIKEICAFLKEMKLAVILVVFLMIGVLLVYKPLQEALIHILVSSFSGSDTSVLSHNSTIEKALELIKNNPFGLGLGVNGPRALNYGSSNIVESSILLMVFEYGIIGALLYFYNYIFILIKAYNNRANNKKVAKTIIVVVMFTFVAFINIPYVQEIECTSLFFISTGIAYGVLNEFRNVKTQGDNIYNKGVALDRI